MLTAVPDRTCKDPNGVTVTNFFLPRNPAHPTFDDATYLTPSWNISHAIRTCYANGGDVPHFSKHCYNRDLGLVNRDTRPVPAKVRAHFIMCQRKSGYDVQAGCACCAAYDFSLNLIYHISAQNRTHPSHISSVNTMKYCTVLSKRP